MLGRVHGEDQEIAFQPQTSHFFSRYRDRLQVLLEPLRISRETRRSTGVSPVQIQTRLSIRATKRHFEVFAQVLVQFAGVHPPRRVTPVKEETPGPQGIPLTNHNVQVPKPAKRQIAIEPDSQCRALIGHCRNTVRVEEPEYAHQFLGEQPALCSPRLVAHSQRLEDAARHNIRTDPLKVPIRERQRVVTERQPNELHPVYFFLSGLSDPLGHFRVAPCSGTTEKQFHFCASRRGSQLLTLFRHDFLLHHASSSSRNRTES